MKQTLQLRVSQHLALTPQLQQSIRLLQLSTLELHQELESMLADNPLLERIDDPLDHSVRLLGDGAIGQAPLSASSGELPSGEAGEPADSGFETPQAGEGGGEGNSEEGGPGNEAEWSFDDVAQIGRAHV